MSDSKILMVMMPRQPTEEMLDQLTAGIGEEWRTYRREQARKMYLDFVDAAYKQAGQTVEPRPTPARLVSIPSGQYAGKASGNRVVVDGEHKFVVETETYVKGISCPCTVIVDAGLNNYYVVFK
jgi:hypothetical protein